ncbi:MAG: DNA polymerase IV [Lachnospiraceae bacterium]|nr:DNA polymerase IV [Lachnospiraceae bacterium]
MKQTIFHIDVNSAYLSWSALEKLKQGDSVDLRTIPSIVGGDTATRHGVVLAKSIPAKAYGIHTGEPVTDALKKCPFLVSCPPDHKLYSEKSHLLMEYLTNICPDIEQVSVDECYMDFTPIAHRYADPVCAAREIKDGIRETFGFTVNIGISDKKILAKMASDFRKPDLVHTLYQSEIEQKMWPLPLASLFMCGKSSVETLHNLGILTIGDLAKADPQIIISHLKSHGKTLWEFANGIDDSRVTLVPSEAKGIGNSTTLSEDALTMEDIRKCLLKLSESVASRLRKAHMQAFMINVEIKYSSFQTVSHQTTLSAATNDSGVIYRTACQLASELWNGTPVRLLGIRTSKLEDENAPTQLTLFDLGEQKTLTEKQKSLNEALDKIRSKYGKDAIMRGSLLK